MILGIDFSLTATGVALIDTADAEVFTVKTKPREGLRGFIDRVRSVADELNTVADGRMGQTIFDSDLIVIEAPAFHAKGSAVDRMFGGWWLFVAELMEESVCEVVTVPPTSLKKFATGKGNAGKDEVMLSAARRFPDVKVTNNNESDALWLAVIGTHLAGRPFAPLPASHTVALEKLKGNKHG